MPRKAYEPDDPMGLRGVGLPEGSLEAMAVCLIEEYVQMGFSDQQLWHLFRDPFFVATHALYRSQGDAWLKEIIDQVRGNWGQPRFTIGRKGHGDTA